LAENGAVAELMVSVKRYYFLNGRSVSEDSGTFLETCVRINPMFFAKSLLLL